jgi:PAS domain S-box-containing protein
MAVFVFSAWMLAMVFSTVVASWHGGAATVGFPLAVGVLGFLLIRLASTPWPRSTGQGASAHGQQQVWVNALCQGMSTPSLMLDKGIVNVANQAFLTLLDYRDRNDQVVGMPFINLLHPVDHEAFDRLLRTCAEDTAPDADGVLRLVRSDGSLLKSRVNLSRLQGVPGKQLVQLVSGGAAVASGVSGDVPAKSDELALVVDQLDLVMFKTDCEGRIAYVNRAWERLSGRGAGQSRGLRLVSVVHPEDRRSVEEPLTAIGRGQLDHANVEFRLVTANGSVVWVILRARACTLPDGDLVGMAGTLIEITRRKQLEATLGSTRRYLNTLLANVPGMVYRGRNDPEWTMEFVSEGCLELTGYEPYELLENGRVTFGSLIHPQDREFVWTQVQRQLVLHKPYQVSYRIIDVKRQQRWVWEQGRGVFSSHGEFLAVEGFITDVSERQGAEEQARRRMWFEARTGMLSRALFDSLLAYVWQQAPLIGYPYAVFVVDLIGMPALIERIGATQGERVLDQMARRFSVINGPGATVSCLGTHQFTVLLTDFRSGGIARSLPETRELIPAASAMAARMAQALSEPVSIGEERHSIAVAVGIALSDTRYVGGDAMLQAARKAAVQAAELGPGHCEFADE